MANTIIQSFEEIQSTGTRAIQLFSGGLDSTYFAKRAKDDRLDVISLYIHVGSGAPDPRVAEVADELDIEFVQLDCTDQFVDGFVTEAIRANAMYDGQFPICSSLSRPLMAEVAVRMARKYDANCVVHSAGYAQNTASRFNHSIRALAPDLAIANPFIGSSTTREEKLQVLKSAGICVQPRIYSIDENIWGRVIENGELDDPGYRVPDHVFLRTKNSVDAPRATVEFTLEFQNGIPVAMDACGQSLRTIIERTATLAGQYGVGRFNGLEDTPLGVKNHEVRESPAATVILKAHAALQSAVLDSDTRRIKQSIDAEWTFRAVTGLWHTPVTRGLSDLIRTVNEPLSGEVQVQVSPGQVFVQAIRSDNSPHFWNGGESLARDFENLSYRELFEISSFAKGLGHKGNSSASSHLAEQGDRFAVTVKDLL